MKKIRILFTCTMILFINGNIRAQTNQGQFLIGELSSINLSWNGIPNTMNIGLSTFKTKSDSGNEDNSNPDKEFSISLTPKVGYFLIDNLAVGLEFTVGYSHANSGNGDYISNSTRTGVGPFIRYYVPVKNILTFTEAYYSYGSMNNRWDYTGDTGEHDYQVQQYGIGIGLGIPLGDKVSFDALLGYQSYIYKAKEDNENNERSIIGTYGLKLGLTVFL